MTKRSRYAIMLSISVCAQTAKCINQNSAPNFPKNTQLLHNLHIKILFQIVNILNVATNQFLSFMFQIVNILNVATNQLLSYPLIDSLSMQDLQRTIEQETKIKVAEQDIILASGAVPDPNLGANQCWNVPVSHSLLCIMCQWSRARSKSGGQPMLECTSKS